jgi:glycine/D-amino acid oxidase-like deaminating enzyme
MADVDVAVIGAGVLGSSVAYALAKAGHRVTVVDRLGGPGQGSTSASSAVVRFNYSTAAGVHAAWESMHGWSRWSEHLGVSTDNGLARFRRTGLVMLDVPIAPKDRVLGLFDAAGIPYEDWDAATLAKRIPGIEPGRFWPPKRPEDEEFWADATGELGAFYTPDAGFVDDPQLAAVNLADAARRHGATYLLRRQVLGVRTSAGQVTGLDLSDGERVDVPVVVNVAGPWSSAVNQLAGVGDDFTVRVRPMRQEVHHVAAPTGFSDGDRLGPVVADLDLGTYMRAAPGGGFLVGGTEPECDPLEWLTDPDEANPNPTADVFGRQVTRAARRFPALGVPPAPRGIAGVYDVADDWTPIYDRTALDGFYVAMGTSGNQFKNAPVVGQFMTAIIEAVENGHDHDAHPVRYVGERTGLTVDLGAFSRRRPVNTDSSGTVMG